MVNNRPHSVFICIFSLCAIVFSMPLFADDPASSDDTPEKTSFYIEETETGFVFHQKLVWSKEQYALRYVVSIEHKVTSAEESQKVRNSVNGLSESDRTPTATEDADQIAPGWERILNYATTGTVLELTLPAGSYRYRIHVYNLLERLAGSSGWLALEINKALQPTIDAIEPQIVFLEDTIPSQYALTGTNLLADTTFVFTNANGKPLFLEPPLISEDNTTASFTIDPKVIDTGTYTFSAKNPGGLTTSAFFTVKFEKPVDIEIEAGYRPSFILSDETFNTYIGTSLLVNTADLKCTFIPVKRKGGYFGISLHPQFYYLQRSTTGFSISSRMWTASADLVYQYPLIKRHLLLDVHAGPMALLIDNLTFTYLNDVSSSAFTSWYLGIDAGAGVQWYPSGLKQFKSLFIEMGIEYEKAFLPNMSLDLISPGIRVGYLF